MKIRSYQVYLLAITLTIVGIACSKNAADTTPVVASCDANTSFSKTILPLFNSTCNLSGCHDGPNAASLNNFQVIHDNASQIRASISTGRMPKDKALAIADKNAILCWVDNGAKNN
ncbi:MAG: hypothetical protein D4R91_02010 [Sediminibacterium sp.]|jgi:queuine/archaeosine tRNA-ribosyltransferase|nr:MAG: hypothetical protein D4R91_02010 [Sediminibacterium sp.]